MSADTTILSFWSTVNAEIFGPVNLKLHTVGVLSQNRYSEGWSADIVSRNLNPQDLVVGMEQGVKRAASRFVLLANQIFTNRASADAYALRLMEKYSLGINEHVSLESQLEGTVTPLLVALRKAATHLASPQSNQLAHFNPQQAYGHLGHIAGEAIGGYIDPTLGPVFGALGHLIARGITEHQLNRTTSIPSANVLEIVRALSESSVNAKNTIDSWVNFVEARSRQFTERLEHERRRRKTRRRMLAAIGSVLCVVLLFVALSKSGNQSTDRLLIQSETPLRVGPDERFKIVDTVSSPNTVKVLDDSTPGWLKVRTHEGKEGWLESGTH